MQTSKDIKTMLSLADYYLHSPQFLSLRGRTQKDYEYVISKVMATPMRSFGKQENNYLAIKLRT